MAFLAVQENGDFCVFKNRPIMIEFDIYDYIGEELPDPYGNYSLRSLKKTGKKIKRWRDCLYNKIGKKLTYDKILEEEIKIDKESLAEKYQNMTFSDEPVKF